MKGLEADAVVVAKARDARKSFIAVALVWDYCEGEMACIIVRGGRERERLASSSRGGRLDMGKDIYVERTIFNAGGLRSHIIVARQHN